MISNNLLLDNELKLYNGLSEPAKTNVTFRKFTSQANVVIVKSTLSSDYTFYGIAQPKSDKQNHRDVDRHRGVYVGQESIDGITFNVWHFTPQSIVMSSRTANKLSFVAEFMQISDDRFLGTEYVPTSSTVDAWLKSRYPEAVNTDIVRVVSEDADYQYNGTTWVALAEKESVLFTSTKSDVQNWDLKASEDAGFPEHDPTTTELIFDELDDRVTLTYLQSNYFTQIQSDDRYFRKDGSVPATGDFDMDGYNLLNLTKLTFITSQEADLVNDGDTRWNADLRCLETMVDSANGVIIQHSREDHKQLRNATALLQANGKVVYISGAQGASPNADFSLATNTDDDIVLRTIGLLTQDIASGQKGMVTTNGEVKDIANSLLTGTPTVGQRVYLGTNGNMTMTRPTGDVVVVCIGIITRNTPTTFNVLVTVNAIPKLEQLSGVEGTFTTGSVLMKQADGTWQAYDLTTKLGELDTKDNDLQSQINALESGIDWKESVATFDDLATTYPDAEKGDTVYVEDEEKVYIFNGTSWVSYASFILSGSDGASKVGAKDGFGGTTVQQQLDNAKTYVDNQDALKIDENFSPYNEITVALSDDDEVIVRDVSTNETKKTKVSNLLQKGSDVYEYGVREVVGQSDPTFERVKKVNGEMTIGVNTGLVANVGIDDEIVENTFDDIAIFNRTRETIISDNGVTQQSNVMVKVSKYYIKEEWKLEGGINYHYIWMSDKKLTGYRLPLPFDNGDGTEKDFVYLSAYEGFVDSNNVLRSVSGELPAHTITRGNFRTYARNNDTSNNTSAYLIQDIQDAVDLIQIPIWIEFAEKNSDEGIGRGVVDLTFDATTVVDGTTTTAIVSNAEGANFTVGMTVYVNSEYVTIQSIVADTPIAGQTTITFEETLSSAILTGANLDPRQWKTGYCDNVVASTGFFRANDGKHPFVWRGMENVWGNMWKFVDGIKISDWYTWVCTDFTQYNDDASDVNGDYALPFVKLNFQNALSSGYVKELGFDSSYPFVKTPTEIGAGTTTYYSDYYYQNTGDRTALLGGAWYHSSSAGLSFWVFSYSLSAAFDSISARLSHRP